jgi:Aspartate/ornithine carbamoyltransferase, Asp/Orn binding domain
MTLHAFRAFPYYWSMDPTECTWCLKACCDVNWPRSVKPCPRSKVSNSVGAEIYVRTGLDRLEVTSELFESPYSIVFDQAKDRLHTIKAVMVATLGPDHARGGGLGGNALQERGKPHRPTCGRLPCEVTSS